MLYSLKPNLQIAHVSISNNVMDHVLGYEQLLTYYVLIQLQYGTKC